jgi:hypothetical protein
MLSRYLSTYLLATTHPTNPFKEVGIKWVVPRTNAIKVSTYLLATTHPTKPFKEVGIKCVEQKLL